MPWSLTWLADRWPDSRARWSSAQRSSAPRTGRVVRKIMFQWVLESFSPPISDYHRWIRHENIYVFWKPSYTVEPRRWIQYYMKIYTELRFKMFIISTHYMDMAKFTEPQKRSVLLQAWPSFHWTPRSQSWQSPVPLCLLVTKRKMRRPAWFQRPKLGGLWALRLQREKTRWCFFFRAIKKLWGKVNRPHSHIWAGSQNLLPNDQGLAKFPGTLRR